MLYSTSAREGLMDIKTQEPSANFLDDLLANAVIEALEEIFGRMTAEAIIHMIAELNQSSREIALRDPKAIHLALLGLFGDGAKIIERLILRKLKDRIEVRIDFQGDFLEEIERIKSFYYML